MKIPGSPAVFVLLLSTVATTAGADQGGSYGPHMWSGGGWMGWLAGPVMMVAMIAIVVACVDGDECGSSHATHVSRALASKYSIAPEGLQIRDHIGGVRLSQDIAEYRHATA